MDNYLSHRWPSEPAARPAPVRHGNLARSLLALAVGLVLIVLILSVSWFSLSSLSNQISSGQWEDDDAVRRPAWAASTDWQPEDFPWGEANPSVRLTACVPHGAALSAAGIYRTVLPSIVGITASSRDGYGMGSGIVATEDGYILTNYHVIDESTKIQVILLSDESSYDAAVIGFDEEKDIAVLKIDAHGLTPAVLGDSDALSVGDAVYAIGNPMGYLYGTMTDGIVSALHRPQEVGGYTMTLIQTSAPLNSGNSGGALINAYGQVVGITVAKIGDTSSETVIEGLGLAIPVSDALPFLNHILGTGQSFRPSIGILCSEVRENGVQGIYVAQITDGTPAVGLLLPKDIIIAANGIPTPKLYNLSRVINEVGVGGSVEFTVLRDSRQVTVSTTLYDGLDS